MIDTFESFVWEPSVVKTNAITAATEAACLVLSVDETVRTLTAEKLSLCRVALITHLQVEDKL